jgi:hypothetical protein
MIRKASVALVYIFFTIFCVRAQEVITPLQSNPLLQHVHPNGGIPLSRRGEATPPAGTTIQLPFFDDFSRPELYPNENGLWMDNATYVNTTFGFHPPSTGVVTFDGLDWRGVPYNVFASGPASADTLTSTFIDLSSSAVDSTDTTIYLSFFYQAQGVGLYETPDIGDSMVLEFRPNNLARVDTSTGIAYPIWIKMWGVDGGVSREPFKQVLVPVRYNRDTNFFYKQFQFRFRNLANPSGNLDTWHLDFVYMARGRTAADTAPNDVGIYKPSGSILKDYYSMPWNQFISSPAKHLGTSIPIYAKNNSNTLKNVYIGYSIKDLTSNTGLDSQLQQQGQNLAAFHDTTFNLTPNWSKLNTFVPVRNDSVQLEIRTIAGSNTGAEPALYRTDDTSIFVQRFSTYLAYDDGTAEGGYSLTNTSNGKVALRFTVDKPDSLYGIGIHFNQSVTDVSLDNFSLAVWNNITSPGHAENDKPVATVDFLYPKYNPWLNDFIYYPLSKPIPVSGAFYIGWTQTSNFELNVGYDNNYSQLSKVATNPNLFYDAIGYWTPSTLPGTPMIRAYIGRVPTAINENLQTEIDVNIYPNPASGQFTLSLPMEGRYNMTMYDLTGKEVATAANLQGNTTINVSGMPKGMYLMRLQEVNGSGFASRRIVIN